MSHNGWHILVCYMEFFHCQYVLTYIPSNQSTNEQNTFCCYLQYSSNSKKYPSLPLKGATLKIAFLVERQISSVEIKTAVSGNVIVSVECDSFSI